MSNVKTMCEPPGYYHSATMAALAFWNKCAATHCCSSGLKSGISSLE